MEPIDQTVTARENPYAPPSSRLGPLNDHRSQSLWRYVGWLLALTPPIAVIVLYFAIRLWISALPANSPFAIFGFSASVLVVLLAVFAIGMVSMIAGIVLLAMVRKR